MDWGMGMASFVRVAEWEDFADEESPPPPEEPKNKKKTGQKGPIKKSKASKSRGAKEVDLRQNKTFRKIEQDLKNRNKRRQKLAEEPEEPAGGGEIYIDKDRAIACGSGAEDLKGDILKHRGKMQSDSKSSELEAWDVNVLIEQSEHELRWGDARKALAYLEKGIRIRPENIDCLVLKGKCLIELSRFRDALEDIEMILTELKDRHNSKALMVKGDALYNLGNFEHALLNYHRASKNATTKEKVGINQRIARCELAIFNAVGPCAASYFRNLEKFLYKIPSNIMGLPWFQLKNVVDANTKQSRMKDRKFLGEMASDKQYLEDILDKLSNQKNLENQCQRKVKSHAQEALDYLIERRDFWAQQNPEYPDLPTELIGSGEKPSWRSVMMKCMKRRHHGTDTKSPELFNVANPYG